MSKCKTCRHYNPHYDNGCQTCTIYNNYAECTPKQTRYERIMADMTIEKMAELLTFEIETNTWVTDNGEYFNYDDALQAEIDWLKGADE